KGRRLTRTQVAGDTLQISFDDGSTMTVRTAGPGSAPVLGVPVKAARRQNTTLRLEFEDGRSMDIPTLPFTAASSGSRSRIVPPPPARRYNGMLLRTAIWDSLDEST